MSHLHTERLAELAEEQPTAGELAHLGSCAQCTGERAAFVALGKLARSGPDIDIPLTSWSALAPALRAESLVQSSGIATRSWKGQRYLQVAAGLLLLAGGAVMGRMSAGGPEVVVAGPTSAAVNDSATRFTTVEEALAALVQSENTYQSASAFIAQFEAKAVGTSETPRALSGRLAALEKVSEVANEALKDAPYDQVMNNLALYASGQREATIRQHNSVMPASLRSTTY